jgi:hypothetical protein
VKIIKTIAGEYIPESIKINNVYFRYRLDSGYITRYLETLRISSKKSFETKIPGEHLPLSSDCGRIHYGIEFLTPVAT